MNPLIIDEKPNLESPKMVIGFSGWMDGGQVSTGTVEYLAGQYNAKPLGRIEPERFYVYNVPGTMEISALFRPNTRIEEGLVQAFNEPENRFFYSESQNLVLFSGQEPHLRWRQFGDAIMEVAGEFGVSMICFVGSVSGLLPHTRKPFFYSSISEERLAELTDEHDLNRTNYEGPASFATYLITRARDRDIPMMTLVAGIPAYVQGRNERGILAAVETVTSVLSLPGDFSDLKARAEKFEDSLDAVVRKRQDLADHIRKLEAAYDDQTGRTVTQEDQELRDWFEKQDIRLD